MLKTYKSDTIKGDKYHARACHLGLQTIASTKVAWALATENQQSTRKADLLENHIYPPMYTHKAENAAMPGDGFAWISVGPPNCCRQLMM